MNGALEVPGCLKYRLKKEIAAKEGEEDVADVQGDPQAMLEACPVVSQEHGVDVRSD